MDGFEQQLRSLVSHFERSYPGLKIDIAAELKYYTSIRDEVLGLTVDTVILANKALAAGESILVEGANATMYFYPFDRT